MNDDDPYDRQRYIDAQAGVYDRALAELRGGCKQSHWMWFVFPQFTGLLTRIDIVPSRAK